MHIAHCQFCTHLNLKDGGAKMKDAPLKEEGDKKRHIVNSTK